MNQGETRVHKVTAERMQLAARVGQKAAIRDVRVTAIHADLTRLPADESAVHQGSWSHSFQRGNGANLLVVATVFRFELRSHSNKSPGETLITVESTFVLTYDVEGLPQFEDPVLDAFAELNGIYNAWPFWRELLQSTLGRMGFGPFTLPTLRIAQ